jgi:chlorobactene glucosyltransferase
MTPFDLIVWFVTGALTVIAGILLVNLPLFPLLGRGKTWSGAWPRVSVLVPARDEAAVIGETVRTLATQDYPDLEVIVLDDHSTDGTGDLARAASDKVVVLRGADLPDDWAGKNWACHQMAQAATGDILVFTDADVRWQPGAVRALVAQMLTSRADLLTVWPTQTTVTWAERLVVPLMALVVMAYLPIWGVHYVRSFIFGAANGQCMAWRRDAYQQAGGHQAVRDNVLEDVTQARIVKGLGLRLRMADGAGWIGCRMYENWATVRLGYAKNILAGYGGVVPLLVATVFHWLIFLFPWVWLMFGGGVQALALVALGLTLRALTAGWTRQRIADALLMPVSAVLMTIIAAQALIWHWRYGGPMWKGRIVKRAGAKS